ncbi:hypothetical protein BLNAU_5181 [Blattamonas nauphoetae]|uniref:Uncharacterized protein n=1 Tax=Blattamonas nauphoetae TaxID=2049346 RepID=A0ABQ9Y8G0_9EUKA|nr:hypothetical protein BLNAU_5181 [Blattamonas nauphoetae]
MSILLLNLCDMPTCDVFLQLGLSLPSDQILELSIALIIHLDRGSLFEVFYRQPRFPFLRSLTTLASHSLHTASVASLHRCFQILHQLYLNPRRNSDNFQSVVLLLMRMCMFHLRFRLPRFAFRALLNVSDLGDGAIQLYGMSSATERLNTEGSVSRLVQEARFHQTCREVLPDLVSPIPARRNAALVLLSKVFERANCGMVVDMCRFGVVECVIAGVEASSSLEEYEMGISILGSILRTLSLSRSIDTMTSFDFSPLLDQF